MAADLLFHGPVPLPAGTEMVEPAHSPTGQHSRAHEDGGCHHQGNPAVLALVAHEDATHVATGSGNWSNPAIWQNGQVPTQGARIVVSEGQTVTVDGVYNAEFKTLRIDGTLKFATDVNTQLKVDTLVSTGCARLEMGTTANPIDAGVTAKVIFADDGAIDTNWDPTRISRGAILMGATEIAGAATTDRVTLATQPVAGATSLQLSDAPVNWKAGDEIVITGTSGATSDEVRTIASVNGTNIQLDRALDLDHVAPKSHLNVYVANKTRNVQFSSENTAVKRRGHIMFAHTHDVKIDHAGFYDLGRTDKSRDLDDVFFEFEEGVSGNNSGAPIHYTLEIEQEATNIRGRYAIHFHRAGVDPSSTPATVNGSVVDGSPGWGFVNHSSHVNFTSNVAYGVWGSAFYTEAGDEIGSFDGNIAIRSVNPRDPVDPETREIATDLGHVNQEFGNSGDGFWLSGHLVSVTNNISSGNSGHGIIIWSDGLVEHDLGAESGRTTVKTANIPNGHLITGRNEIPVWWSPLAEVSNNEVSNAVIGFRTRYIHSNGYVGEGGSAFHASPDQAYIDTLNPEIDGLTVWGSREGVYLNYSERMSLKNAEIIGIGEEFVYQEGTTNIGVGLDLANQISRGSGRIENVTIEGFGMGIMAPRNEQWVMDNITLKNTTDMMIEEPRLSPRALTMSNFTFGSLDGTAVAHTAGQRRNIDIRPTDFTSGDGQPFFFLLPDHITMDGQGIYSSSQNGNFVPLQEAPDGNPIMQVPQSYVGKTNQQLQNQFGLSFGGNVTPSNAQNVSWIRGGRLGSAMPAATSFPQLWDMTNGGENREPPKGGPVPELTGNRLEINSGQTVTFMNTNLNTTDTNTGFAGLTYSVSQVQNGYFANRNNPTTPITSFTQAQVNGGVIRFVHDGSDTAPDYRVTVSDGTTTTSASAPVVTFNGDGSGGNQSQEIGFSGVATQVSHNWKTISLPRSFSNPVIVAGGATRNGGHPGVVRVRNVTSNSFEIRFQEWDYLDGQHAFEDISYIVLEAGTHELTDGTRIAAGTVNAIHENFSNVTFSGSFNNAPVVLSQIMTTNGGAAVTDRIRNVSASGFEVQMQEEQAANHLHYEETLGWIAIEQGTASSNDTMLNAILTSGINHRTTQIPLGLTGGNLVVLTDLQTRIGGDPATVRHSAQSASSVTVFVEEEKSGDNEIQHIRETVGTLALQPGMLFATTAGDGDSSSRPSGSGPSENNSPIAQLQVPVDQKGKAGNNDAGDDLKSRLDALMSTDAGAVLSGSVQSVDVGSTGDSLLVDLQQGVDSSDSSNSGEKFDLLDESFESFN